MPLTSCSFVKSLTKCISASYSSPSLPLAKGTPEVFPFAAVNKEHILNEEDGHINDIEEVLDQMNQMGIQMFLSIQTG